MNEHTNKTFEEIIGEYRVLLKERFVSPVTFAMDESTTSFNYDFALQTFGSSFIDQLAQELKISYITHKYNFTGDWWMYAFIKYVIETEQIDLWNDLQHQENTSDNDKPTDNIYIHLEGAVFNGAKMNGIKLRQTNLTNSLFYNVHMEGGELINVSLRNARFSGVYLIRAYLQTVDFTLSRWTRINLRDTRIFESNLFDMKCKYIDITDKTEFNECEINSDTVFENTSIDVIKNNKVKSQLTYCIRRYKWELWYENDVAEEDRIFGLKHKLLRLFWFSSDYGYSTKRIVGSFLVIALFFALLYWCSGVYDYLFNNSYETWGLVEGLFQDRGTILMSPLTFDAVIRSIYFSVVTMTTLGFGDIYANHSSVIGHIILVIQVIIGYVLLAVLVTRMSVLFSNNGPTYIPEKSFKHNYDDRIMFYKWSIFLFIVTILILAIEVIS
jgi:hypothetical protein